MANRELYCRTHGGTFTVPSKPGRPPVRCTADNPCKPAPAKVLPPTNATRTASAIKNKRTGYTDTLRASIEHDEAKPPVRRASKGEMQAAIAPAVVAPESPTATNPSVEQAKATKARLEPLGWDCKGEAFSSHGTQCAKLLATRGDELLVIEWVDGKLIGQTYTLWHVEQQSVNGAPEHRLKFDPDEIGDSELVRRLSGMKVTWWNRIARSEETAIVLPDKIRIEHAFNGLGDEMPGDRVVHFLARGGGFRTLRVAALLRVGAA